MSLLIVRDEELLELRITRGPCLLNNIVCFRVDILTVDNSINVGACLSQLGQHRQNQIRLIDEETTHY